jgi:hypothetical protein
MAHVAHNERADMSAGRKPTDGPMMAVEVRRVAVMSTGWMRVGAGVMKNAARGVVAGAR